MTRENKLSIVIAFGLLIFVGMLVADHFSIASHREVAALGSNMPPPPLLQTEKLVGGSLPAQSEQAVTNPAGDKIHIVKQGETLRSICRIEYGDSGLATPVAQWNNLADPDNIELGSRIALPSRTSLMAGSFVLSQPNQIAKAETSNPRNPKKPRDPRDPRIPKNSQGEQMATYKVMKGDTLSEIAQKVLGTVKKTQVLIDNNRDVMPNPDRIRPGMVLRYPTNNQ